jgi:biopolymer transport protein ExbD
MVTARLIVARGVEVEKPRSSVGGDLKGTILVSVDREGGIYVHGERYPDRPTARAALAKLVQADPAAKAIVAGDARASYGAIFNAVEACKQAGIESIALADEPLRPGESLPPPPPPPGP